MRATDSWLPSWPRLRVRFRMHIWLSSGALALLCALMPPAGQAEMREAVGAVPLVPGSKLRDPRGAAIDAALHEAVVRVAGELLLEGSGNADEPLDKVLGTNLVPYASNFRLIEDRGQRPILFSDHPDAASEYVVIVEVDVDVDRLRDQLIQEGLLEAEWADRAIQTLEVEVVGLDRYGAYEAFRTLLVDSAGAEAVTPLELEAGRALLAVRTHQSDAELVASATRSSRPGLQVVSVHSSGERPRLAVRWDPGAPGATSAGGSTQSSR